ncbi:MAG: hypothetical protein GTN49_07570, partial [candidate division Zixibacteria bacterium]|nr:hypothetical protein [candidate division Zixibacteria bacterium]
SRADAFPGEFAGWVDSDGTSSARWLWWADAAATILFNIQGGGVRRHERFWTPPLGILPSPDAPQQFAKDPLSGWYFYPRLIVLRFYNASWVGKVARVTDLLTYAAYISELGNPGLVQNYGARELAHTVKSTNDLIQAFSTDGPFENGDLGIGPLWPAPLIPGHAILLTGINGLVATDKIRLTMAGFWYFTPRLVEATDERDG